MYNIEHPQISNALKWGYPSRPALCPLCADCGQELGDYAYEAEPNHFVCEDCFKERMEDYLRTNPRELAEALDILWEYRA